MSETTPGIDETLLDLDALDPVTQRVKVCGRAVALHAPTARLVKLFDRVKEMEHARQAGTEAYNDALDALVAGIVPDLSDAERGGLTPAKQALVIGRGFAEAELARQRVLVAMRTVLAEGKAPGATADAPGDGPTSAATASST